MISRPTPANSSTHRSSSQPSRHSSPQPSSRPTTPSRRSMATQSPRRSRTKAKAPTESAADDALFALLGIPTPEPSPASVAQVPTPKKAQKGLLTLTQPQMAAIRGEEASASSSRPKGRKAVSALAATESDGQDGKRPRTRRAKGKGKAAPGATTGTESEGFTSRPKHARTESEPAAQMQESYIQDNPAPSIPWDGPPRLDRELEPFDVSSVPMPALLEPLENGSTPSRVSSAKRAKQIKGKRNREKDQDRTDDSDAFETTSLSRSLPASSFVSKGKQVEMEADVWDMPLEVGRGAGEQGLTWQQALQQSNPNALDAQTPTKRPNRKANPNPATGTRQQPTRAAKVERRYSLDQTAIQSGAGHGFVYPGMNANRAPQIQTPTKVVPASVLTGSLEPAVAFAAGHGQALGSVPAAGLFKQYAGPTFHNSPLAGSLPRPNNDDF